VALAVLSPANIASLSAPSFAENPISKFLMDEALSFDLERRRVHFKEQAEMSL